MKIYLFIIGIFITFSAFPNEQEYRCKEHSHFLKIHERGFEHINHELLINGVTAIKELSQSMWFIENITCTQNGFKVIASHIQYGDSAKKVFNITVSKNSYNIE